MAQTIKCRLRKGDTVILVAGNDKGKIGRIADVIKIKKTGRIKVVVEGCCYMTKHVARTQDSPGKVVKKERPIDISNVSFYDRSLAKPTRIGYKLTDEKKMRFSKKSNDLI